MNPSKEDLREHYLQLHDEELIRLWRQQTLTEMAQSVLQAELLSRGIELKQINEIESQPVAGNEAQFVAEGDTDSLVTLASYSTGPEAHGLRLALESEGIPAFVIGEHLAAVQWFLSQAGGGVRVQVPATYHEQALKILHDIENGKYFTEDE